MATNSFLTSARRAGAEAIYKGEKRGEDEEWIACGGNCPFPEHDSQKLLA
jgi:hypothetical protein